MESDNMSLDTTELDAKELREAARRSFKRIIELAEAEGNDKKFAYEINKWICEMHFGKPSSNPHNSDTCERQLSLNFDGELDKWSV